MNRTRIATVAGLTILSLLAYAAMLAVALPNAHAQNRPECGGNKKTYMAPYRCERSTTVNGITGSVGLSVDETGFGMVTATIAAPPNVDPGPMYLQVKIHKGISSDPAGVVAATDVFDGNTATLNLTMPRSLSDNCTSQWDIKIVPGTPTNAHVSPVYRVAAPLVGIDLGYCQPPPTTTTTAPTTVPATTVPGSSPPTTNPTTGSTTPASSVSTTAAPTASSVVGDTIPATGPTPWWVLFIVGGVSFLGVGLILIWTDKRAEQ